MKEINETRPTHLDLFSGIGGFSLAFEAEGFETIGFAEIDPYASAVLRKHWPNVTNYGDVRNVPAVRCDVLTGGFPCQPYSCAGRQRGENDDRHLWPAMRDVIERVRPSFILGENVPGIIDIQLDAVCSDLEGIGYEAQSIGIPAAAVGGVIYSERIWILAASTGYRQSEQGKQHRQRPDQSFSPATWNWPPRLTAISDIPRRIDGISNRMDRLRCLGNAIVPQVAQIFAKAIRQLI